MQIQAAIAAQGYGLLGTNGDPKPLATASIAKVIVALCVLDKQPLEPGQTGPKYTVTADDVAGYQKTVAMGGSALPVTKGEQLTEYQALEALMIPSANNVADSLTRWVFGSHDAYATYAAAYLQKHGLNDTRIGPDASGFNAGTVSTASDLTSLGLLALQNPTLMEIAGKTTANFPVAGTVTNYNTVLGTNGITGLKTGNNAADPGAFLMTAKVHVGDTTVLVTGAVMGAADLPTALRGSAQLAGSLQQAFEQVHVSTAGQAMGTVHAAWGASATIITDKPLQLVRWKGTRLSETHRIDASKHSGQIGTIQITAGQAKTSALLKLQQPLPGPSFWWRLTRH